MALQYIKYRQRQLEKEAARVAELEAKEEAARVAELEAETRKQEEVVARKKYLLERQEAECLRQKRIQKKEKLEEQKWNKQFDTLVTQVKDRTQKNDKLEEIKIIIQNREPSLQELDWDSWLSDPLNQKLADLDYDHAMEMFKRDNLMAKRRTRGGVQTARPSNYSLTFSGNDTGATRSYVTTDFNPDDYNLHLGFTVSYWVRPDEVGNTMFAFGRKHNNNQRFVFGINRKRQGYFGIGGDQLTTSWVNMDTPVPESMLVQDGSYWNLKTDGTWYHFVVTYDDRSDTSSGTDRKLYVNGVLRQTDNINWSDTGGGPNKGMYFGARNVGNSYNNGWACSLDEVAIYDTARDAVWVKRVYEGGTTYDHKPKNNLVGYWKFNEGRGITVRDHSGNGNHGTFGAISGNTTDDPTWEKRRR
jgi:hypothetical protein